MKHLKREQRYQISALLKIGFTQKRIAMELNISPSTICREISRNKTKRGGYSAVQSQENYEFRKQRFSRPRKLTVGMKRKIEEKLVQEQWSPEEIVGYFRKEGLAIVCVETIYAMIRLDKHAGGKLFKHLRHQLKHRKRQKIGKKMPIKDRVSIHERPTEVLEKTRIGDWEMDLIIGENHKNAILVLVERKTKFVIMDKLDCGKQSKPLAKMVVERLFPFKKNVFSITTDNGGEFAEHLYISQKLSATVYFADPYAAWQKGLVENTNKLIRQYIPKKTNFNTLTNQQIKEIQYKLNRRPRKTLNYEMPFSCFFSNIA